MQKAWIISLGDNLLNEITIAQGQKMLLTSSDVHNLTTSVKSDLSLAMD